MRGREEARAPRPGWRARGAGRVLGSRVCAPACILKHPRFRCESSVANTMSPGKERPLAWPPLDGAACPPRGDDGLWGTADSTGDLRLWRTCPETQRPRAAKSTLYVRVPGAQGFGSTPGQDLGRGCGQGPAAVPTGPEQRLLGWRPHVAVGGARLLTAGGAAGESLGQGCRLPPEPSAMLSVT